MIRRARETEIFSLSAIDLFAAAMAAFALLTVILLPFYQKEIQERTPENAISDLLRAAEDSQVETIEKRKALEAKRSAAAANVSDIRSEEEALLARFRAAEAALEEKKAAAQIAVPVPEPEDDKPVPVPTPQEDIVEFRFLGMNTQKSEILVLVDMNRCMAGHEASIQNTLERIFNSLQSRHFLLVMGFQQTDAGPRVSRWPSSGSSRNVSGSAQADAARFTRALTRQFGGSASMLHAFDQAFQTRAEAIFLVSDGLPNPRVNDGLNPGRLASEITRRNGGRKEIHSVVVGNYFDYEGTVEFMERLSGSNSGQFMALASDTKGVCD